MRGFLCCLAFLFLLAIAFAECGDSYCQASDGERCDTCLSDCACPGASRMCLPDVSKNDTAARPDWRGCVDKLGCGDGICSSQRIDPRRHAQGFSFESCDNCQKDCACQPYGIWDTICIINISKDDYTAYPLPFLDGSACVRALKCGDGVCSMQYGVDAYDVRRHLDGIASENCENCPDDCGCVTDNNPFGVCDPVSNKNYSMQGCVSVAYCGDGFCDTGNTSMQKPLCKECPENCATCPKDCVCGYQGITPLSCVPENKSSDAMGCGYVASCGNGVCDSRMWNTTSGGEDCKSCPEDCYCRGENESCLETDINGWWCINPDEYHTTWQKCGGKYCWETCGDKRCDFGSGENCVSCTADCACETYAGFVCDPSKAEMDPRGCYYNKEEAARQSGTTPPASEDVCGDGYCTGSENCKECESDCGCKGGDLVCSSVSGVPTCTRREAGTGPSKCNPAVNPNAKCLPYCKHSSDAPDIAMNAGICNPTSGGCEYPDQMSCTGGCEYKSGWPRAKCNEVCDNNIDDDLVNGKDCGDPACNSSIYCFCKKLDSSPGEGKRLSIAFGGVDYIALGTDSKGRDDAVLADAQKAFDKLSTTVPFNEIGIDFYVTRLPKGAGKGDLLGRCPADIAVVVEGQASGRSQSSPFSMETTIYKQNPEGLIENVVTHELAHAFAGLWDEYPYSVRVGPIMGRINALKHNVAYARRNCVVTGDPQVCQEYFSKITSKPFSCIPGCVGDIWYRSSQTSIMEDQSTQSQFNDVCIELIRGSISNFKNPKPPPKADPPSYPGLHQYVK